MEVSAGVLVDPSSSGLLGRQDGCEPVDPALPLVVFAELDCALGELEVLALETVALVLVADMED